MDLKVTFFADPFHKKHALEKPEALNVFFLNRLCPENPAEPYADT